MPTAEPGREARNYRSVCPESILLVDPIALDGDTDDAARLVHRLHADAVQVEERRLAGQGAERNPRPE